ncbi:MAG: phosphotransferase [Caulobacteraceae bacterium]
MFTQADAEAFLEGVRRPRSPSSMDNAEAGRVFTPAAIEALKAFPIEPEGLELVALSENVTFRVTDRHDGEAYVLRLHPAGAITRRRSWSRSGCGRGALAKAGVAVPIPLTTRGGDDYVSVEIEALGQRRQAGMTRWIEGEWLADLLERGDDVEAPVRYFEQLGAIEAAMHNQSSGWRPPPAFTAPRRRPRRPNVRCAVLGSVLGSPGVLAGERALVLETRDRIRGAMDRLGRDPSMFGMIHATCTTAICRPTASG